MRHLILTVIIVFSAGFVAAQDKIHRKNGQIIKARVLEISSQDIKYKEIDKIDGPVYVLEKERISKIEFEDGRLERFIQDFKDAELYKDQCSRAVKLNFLAPLGGYTEFSFEKSTGVGKSYELSFGIIGAGINQTTDWTFNSFQQLWTPGSYREGRKSQFGFYGGIGYKFSKLPDLLFFKPRLSHLMQGAYVRPQVYIGNYSENVMSYKNNNYVAERKNISFGAIELEFGKQWVFNEKFLIDLYWGLGYGFDNKGGDEDSFFASSYNYSVSRVGKSPGLAFSGGLRLGMLIK